MKILWYAMSVLFVAAAGVQFNDTEAVLMWVVVYLGAAGVAGFWPTRHGLAVRGQLLVLLGAFVIEIVSVVWAIMHLGEVWAVGEVDFGSKVQRDFGGLVIVAVTMSTAISKAKGSRLLKKRA